MIKGIEIEEVIARTEENAEAALQNRLTAVAFAQSMEEADLLHINKIVLKSKR